MALPKQVAQQLKELEELEKQLAAADAEQNPVSEQITDAVTQAPAEQSDEPAPEPAPAPESKPREATPEVAEETWQQRYRTLKGMYDAEVPRLHAQVKELQQSMATLQAKLDTKPAEAAPVKQPTSLVTDEDVEAFGKDLIDVQRKVAREVAMEFKTEIEELRAENRKLQEQIQQTGTQVGEVTFEQRLYQMVPDWAAINADPRWFAWLDEIDPMVRGPRRTMAQQVYNAGDVDGVAYYVKLFKDSVATTPTANPKQAELERQVQPSRSAAAQVPVSQKGKTYSTQDIEKMFLRVKDLNVAHRFDDAKKLEAEIDAAYMEGRVVA